MAHGRVRIDEMYAFILVDPADDTEGVPAFTGPNGMAMPMMGADLARVEALKPIAQQFATTLGVSIEVCRFTVRERIGLIEP